PRDRQVLRPASACVLLMTPGSIPRPSVRHYAHRMRWAGPRAPGSCVAGETGFCARAGARLQGWARPERQDAACGRERPAAVLVCPLVEAAMLHALTRWQRVAL